MKVYLRIIPGDSNFLISLLFDEHAEKLSFLQIFLGHFRTFHDGLTAISFIMAKSEFRRSDRRGVTP